MRSASEGETRRAGLRPDPRTALQLAAAAALLIAAFALAAANVAAVPRRRPVPPHRPESTPVFVPRADVTVTPVPIPTPIFATYRSLPLFLPVKPKQITLISFHQAAGARTPLHMSSLVTITKLSEVASGVPSVKKVSGGPDESAEIASAEEQLGVPEIYGGRVIRLWRTGRTGEPDTAVDVGAKPKTPVFAPVTGVVTVVQPYRLYGEYDDYEIHIRPKGWDRVDCVVLHVQDPKVRVGDTVAGGVTQLAEVRWLSRYFASQLDEYTHDGGNHTHVQLNQLPQPGAVQLVGGDQEDRPGVAGVRTE